MMIDPNGEGGVWLGRLNKLLNRRKLISVDMENRWGILLSRCAGWWVKVHVQALNATIAMVLIKSARHLTTIKSAGP